MSGGYTPVFNSVFTGTLCGKYPDTAAWLFLLALADKNGTVDMTPQYISGVTGMPVSDLQACIDRFMTPDEFSRSQEEEGRRLVLLAPPRPWGWRIVNFAHYREKARLMAKSQREVESGSNKERLTAAHRRSPPKTAADPLSNADSDSNTDKNPPTPQGGGDAPGDAEEKPRKSRRSSGMPKQFHEQVVAAYHEQLPNLPAVRDWSDDRRRKLDERVAERVKAGKPADQVDYWRGVFRKVSSSDFLCGRKGDWRCPGLEWLISRSNFRKVIEGAYDNTPRVNGASHAR